MVWTEEQRRLAFESLVIRGIWLIAKAVAHPSWTRGAWRADAIAYFDEVGNQSEGSKAHRRERDYPE